MPLVTLLGPQRFHPTLGEAVKRAAVTGQLASVTAGWQEREDEDRELHEHLGERTTNLRLYERSEEVFESDPALFAAHRERQDRLRSLQEVYRLRLAHAKEAARELLARQGDGTILEPERREAIEAIRRLDDHHVGRIVEVHREFDARIDVGARPAVARHLRQVDAILARCEAIAVAGGHVAILTNRLRLFGFGARLRRARCVFAWSAGAMAIAERIVLFHDHPPQGKGNAEVLEVGFGLVPGIVPLPHGKRRLALEDRDRVGLFARRFAPAVPLVLEDGGHGLFESERLIEAAGVSRLGEDGRVAPIEPTR